MGDMTSPRCAICGHAKYKHSEGNCYGGLWADPETEGCDCMEFTRKSQGKKPRVPCAKSPDGKHRWGALHYWSEFTCDYCKRRELEVKAERNRLARKKAARAKLTEKKNG